MYFYYNQVHRDYEFYSCPIATLKADFVYFHSLNSPIYRGQPFTAKIQSNFVEPQ